MKDQQVVSQESRSHQRRNVFLVITFVAAGLAICTVMKAFVCGKIGESCPFQGISDQVDCGCTTAVED